MANPDFWREFDALVEQLASRNVDMDQRHQIAAQLLTARRLEGLNNRLDEIAGKLDEMTSPTGNLTVYVSNDDPVPVYVNNSNDFG